MNFLRKGFILNDVNNGLNFSTYSNCFGFPSFTVVKCEQQKLLFSGRLSIYHNFFFFQKSSLKKLAAANGIYTLHQQLTFQICCLQVKTWLFTNKFHQVWEMKSKHLLFLLNPLPPTRILDSEIKTLTSVSRVLMT